MIIAVPLMAVIHVYRQIQDHFLANLSQEENDYVKLDRDDEKSGEYIRRTDSKSGCFSRGKNPCTVTGPGLPGKGV